ncbi:TIGR04282 family arsenosugar biosynthesis glycosyltransferase [Gordonia sp. DT219]|uniref:TIGR04282 family arsenosugar biosynthesis glycosyltransferase n=1 Tax=Gordonia sp. DT219 TaxID=3416658 RepID=UPI003CF28D08
MSSDAAILIVAKSPVPGAAKTRLAPVYGAQGAAQLAASALLDTLRQARAVEGARVLVAWSGELTAAIRRDELAGELAACDVFAQRGNDFAERLMNAHLDAARAGIRHVLQIGMDTPQLGPTVMSRSLERVATSGPSTAWLGPADDGGWWALGLTDAAGADLLRGVPMSRAYTAAHTTRVLRRAGLRVNRLPWLRDVDHPEDVAAVASSCSAGAEFAATASAIGPVASAS